MPNLKQNEDGSMGIQGAQLDKGGFIPVDFRWDASTVNYMAFIADRPYRVLGLRSRVTAAGTDVGAVTATINKTPSGTAIASGTALHSGTINLKGTANTNQALTLSATSSDLNIAAGDAIGLAFTGVLTTATGAATVFLAPM